MNNVLLILVFFFCLNSFSQTKEEAIRDAKKTAEATLKSDIKTVLDYTFPPVVKVMGGKKNALKFITKTMSDMTSKGFSFKKADVISASNIVKEQNQYRCYIKNNYVMTYNGQKIVSESYLLGIYNEKEKIWNFIEAKQLVNPSINKILPNFKTKLIIPQGKKSIEKI